MPAYNAARTLERTVGEIDRALIDHCIVVDDGSHDDTVRIARSLGMDILFHDSNQGYGAAQKTAYRYALGIGADIVVMLHPDYQYPPRLVPALVGMITSQQFDIALGSRITGRGARKGGMPGYKYFANRFLTAVQNVCFGVHLTDYHTGLRAFSRRALEALPFEDNSDDFVFDNQILAQALARQFNIGEISCPAGYHADASSIGFVRSVYYGFGVLATTIRYLRRG